MNPFEYIFILPLLIFIAGMLFQAAIMLQGKWEEGDVKKMIVSFLYGLIGMMPSKNEASYSVFMHLVFSSFIGALIFIIRFRKKLIARINSQTLLVWNILLLVIFVSHYGMSPLPYLLIAIPTVLTLANAFSDFDKSFGWQVFFYTWFAVLMTVIGIYQLGGLGFLHGGNDLTIGSVAFDIFILGASILYILVNIFFVISLIPLKGKGQTYSQRIREVRAHMQLLAEGYIWKKDNRTINSILIIALPVTYYINHIYSFCGENTIIGLTLIGTSFFGNYGKDAVDQIDIENKTEGGNYSDKSVITGA